MKKILLVCGAGVVTCTVIRKKLEEELKARGLEGTYEIAQADAGDVAAKSAGYDVCVTTTVLGEAIQCPVVMATGLLFGSDRDAVVAEICQYL